MHKRGVGYEASVMGSSPFYMNDKWEGVPVEKFDPGMTVKAGSTFDYYCDYKNTEAHDVYQGPRTTDEMCMLIGSYYPADPATSYCADAKGNQFMGGAWVGQGTATCKQTWECIQTKTANSQQPIQGLTECMLSANPNVANETSALTICLMENQMNPGAACGAQIAACNAK
jgi:hypothetical protein